MHVQEGDTRVHFAERGEDKAGLFTRGEEDEGFGGEMGFEEGPEEGEFGVEGCEGVVLD
jgi:hypothetical protein